jgi:hypothetical protein
VIGLAVPLVGAALAFGAREVWGVLHVPAPIVEIQSIRTSDAFLSRGVFYKSYVHAPAPPSQLTGDGAVFMVQTSAQHAPSCRLLWTVRNVRENQTVGLVDQPAADVAGGTACDGEKYVWLPWPCVTSGTVLQFEIGLIAGSKKVLPVRTESFRVGGSC